MEINDEFKKDAKEAVKQGVLFAFCPKHLEIEGRQDLYVFPFNIMFAKWRNEPDGSLTMGSAVYNPDLTTFIQDKEKWSMTYRNQYGGDSYVVIHFNVQTLEYRGDKYVNGKYIGSGIGQIKSTATDDIEKGWKLFFFHLTILGLANGEQCEFKPVKLP